MSDRRVRVSATKVDQIAAGEADHIRERRGGERQT
jgi:hypothetical protein